MPPEECKSVNAAEDFLPPDVLLTLRERHGKERERLYRLADAHAQFAFSKSGCRERRFNLQGRPFTLRFAGHALEEAMCRALAHLEVPSHEYPPELTVDCWDCAVVGLPLPMPHWPAEYFTARGEILGLDSPQMRAAFFRWLNLISLYFPNEKRAFYCLENGQPFPLQQAGSPALTIFNWWAEENGLQLIHAAAIATERGGILIAGHGGAGKSTLSFSTIGSPLRYISDDYCLLSGNPSKAISLFSSGKLTERSLKLLPYLRTHAANAGIADREKALFYLAEEFPDSLMPEAPLRAVVLSCLSSTETRLEPIDLREVYAVIAASTLRQLAGTRHPSFIRLRHLLENLPAFRLHHGSNDAETHQLLSKLCAS